MMAELEAPGKAKARRKKVFRTFSARLDAKWAAVALLDSVSEAVSIAIATIYAAAKSRHAAQPRRKR